MLRALALARLLWAILNCERSSGIYGHAPSPGDLPTVGPTLLEDIILNLMLVLLLN